MAYLSVILITILITCISYITVKVINILCRFVKKRYTAFIKAQRKGL